MTRNSERIRPRRADVRARVLDAARAVFAEAGYHGASLDSIAARAGFSKGAVYSNFAGKDDLFLALLEDELDARAEQGAAAAGSADDLAPLGAAVLALATQGAMATIVFAEFRVRAARDPELAARLGALREALTASVAHRLEVEVARRGLALTVPPPEAAATLLALVNGVALEQIGRPEPVVSAATVSAVLTGLVARF